MTVSTAKEVLYVKICMCRDGFLQQKEEKSTDYICLD